MEQNRERLFLCCSNYKWKITYSAEQVELPSWIEWSIVLMFYVMAWFILIIGSLHYFFPPQKALLGILFYWSKCNFWPCKEWGVWGMWGEVAPEKMLLSSKNTASIQEIPLIWWKIFCNRLALWLSVRLLVTKSEQALCHRCVWTWWNSAEQINLEEGGCCKRKQRGRRSGRGKRMRRQKQ